MKIKIFHILTKEKVTPIIKKKGVFIKVSLI